MLVVLAVATAGLFVAALPARAEQLRTTVSGYGVRVRVYNQMCDNGFQHTRLNVNNLSSQPVTIDVTDPEARNIEYGPSGFIPAGTAKSVSITANPNAPARNATVTVNPGGPLAIPIPYKQCVEVVPTTVVSIPPSPHDPGTTPIAQVLPGVTARATPAVTTVVEAATLPFTGADVRFISALAGLFVVLGGFFMLLQFRNDSYNTLLLGEVLTHRGLFVPAGGSEEA